MKFNTLNSTDMLMTIIANIFCDIATYGYIIVHVYVCVGEDDLS